MSGDPDRTEADSALAQDQQGVPMTGADLAAWRAKHPKRVRSAAEWDRIAADIRQAQSDAAARTTD